MLKKLAKYSILTKKTYRYLFIAIFINIIGTGFSLIIPLKFREIIDLILDGNSLNIELFFYMFILIFLGLSCQILAQYMLNVIGVNVVFRIRKLVMKKILTRKKEFFDKEKLGEVSSILTNDTSIIHSLISSSFPEFIVSFISIFLIIIFLFNLSIVLSFCVLIVVPTTTIIFIIFGNKLAAVANETQKNIGKLNEYSNFITINNTFIKESQSEDYEYDRGLNINNVLLNIGKRQAKISSLITPILSSILIIMILLVITVGIFLISENRLTVGSLVAYLVLVFELLNPIAAIGSAMAGIKSVSGASDRIFNLLGNSNTENLEFSKRVVLGESIKISNLSFKYPSMPNKTVLKNVDFELNSGEITAIVGPSGSGKSTILSLIEKKYDNYSGSIFFDGIDSLKLGISDVRFSIANISQDIPLIDGTIRDNLLYGLKKQVLDEELHTVSQLTCFDVVLNEFPNGLDTELTVNSGILSEGQKQRLAITRSFLKDKPILLLDEITSSLDSLSEKVVTESLKKISKNKLVLINAHRLSTIQQANKIIFLEHGKITGVGSHSELLKRHVDYRMFIESQAIERN